MRINRHFHPFILLSAAALLTTCTTDKPLQNDHEEQTPSATAGQFGLSLLQGLGRSTAGAQAQADTASPVQFDLGAIRSSNGYYFLIYNTGQRPITEIAILSDNDHFIVSPKNIDSLMPDGKVNMMPIIKVSVVHGTAIEGIGTRTCLPAGDNTASLTVTGKTKTSADMDTAIILAARLKVQAFVVSFSLDLACSAASLESPQLWSSGVKLLDRSMGGPAPDYGISASGTNITPGKWAKIINQSNLPVVVSAYYERSQNPGMRIGPISDSLGIGDSVFINRAIQFVITVCIDGNHTVNSFNALQPQSDGRTYFNIWSTGTTDSTLDCAPDSSSDIIDLGAL